MFLLLFCLLLLPLWEFAIVLCFDAILVGKRGLVALLSFRDDCVALPRGAMGCSAVCECGIS